MAKITDPLPDFPEVSIAQMESDLNNEFRQLESGYNTAKTRRLQDWKEYRFQLYGNEIEGQSKMVDSTIFNAVEWMLPAFIQPFVETKEFINTEPTDSSVRSLIVAEVMRELLTYQIRKKNAFYMFLYDIAKSMMVQGYAFAKLTWVKKDNAWEPVGRPGLHAIPAAQIRYDWTCQNFWDSNVVTQEEDMSKSDILKLMGSAKGVLKTRLSQVLEGGGSSQKTSRMTDERLEQPGWVQEKPPTTTSSSSLFLRREHWTEYDLDGEGIETPVLAVFINGTLVQVMRNPYKFQRPPFVMAECVRDPQGNPASGWSEILRDIQKFRTGILRLTSDNLNAQNNGLMEVDSTNVDHIGMLLLRQAPSGTRTPIPSRKIGSIAPLSPTPIAQHAFTAWEMLEVMSENRSGNTRYSQGLDSGSLNQTATGITNILQRSDMRMWEMAKRFSETALTQIARMLISMNQQFLDKQDIELQFGLPGDPTSGVLPRPAKSWVTLAKEDIGGFFNVNISLQTATDKQKKIENTTSYLQYVAPYIEAGIIPKSVIRQVNMDLVDLLDLTTVQTLLRDQYEGSRGVVAPSGEEPGAGGVEAASGESAEAGAPEATGSVPGLGGIDLAGLLGGGPGAGETPVGGGEA